MRSLNRDRRSLWYSNVTGTESILDEYGNDTLEERKTYAIPSLVRVSVSTNAGQEVVDAFGSQTEYSRTVSMTGSCPMKEGAKVWFGVPFTGQHNYVVARVADSKNCFLVALREASVRD